MATNALLSSQLIVGIIFAKTVSHLPSAKNHRSAHKDHLHANVTPQGYDITSWQQFLIYIGFTLLAFLINAFLNSVLPRIYRGALIWSLGGFAIVAITVLACSSPDFNSAKFVFTDFINQTGCVYFLHPSSTLFKFGMLTQ